MDYLLRVLNCYNVKTSIAPSDFWFWVIFITISLFRLALEVWHSPPSETRSLSWFIVNKNFLHNFWPRGAEREIAQDGFRHVADSWFCSFFAPLETWDAPTRHPTAIETTPVHHHCTEACRSSQEVTKRFSTTMSWRIFSILVSMLTCDAVAFAFVSSGTLSSTKLQKNNLSTLRVLPFDLGSSSTMWTAVDTFDGSTVDPVVVSNVFWAGLKAKFISVIIGQFLAAIVFSIIASVAASQMSKLGSFVSENIFRDEKQNPKVKTESFVNEQT